MTITAYPFEQTGPLPGTIDGPGDPSMTRARTNPAIAQEGTLTVGGVATDGLYQAKFFHPDEPDNPIVVEFTRAAGETNNQISAKLYADAVKKLALKAGVTVLNAVTTYKFANALITYTVTTTAPAPGTLVWAQTVAAGGSVIPFGRFLIGGGDGLTCKMIEAASAIAAVIGVSERSLQMQQTADQTADDGWSPSREVPVVGGSPIRVEVEETVTPADTVYIRRIASGDNTKLGIVGKSADGGNCIDASSIAKFDSSATRGQTARLIIHIPLPAA